MNPAADPSRAHLLRRIGVVEERIRALVAERRADDPQPDDPFRGLYLPDDAVDRLLATPFSTPTWPAVTARLDACERAADVAEHSGTRIRLRELARAFDLAPLDTDLLLVALACEIDPRFEQFFGYLNDDVTRKHPSVAVALALCGVPLTGPSVRSRLIHGPLVTGALVHVDDAERPFPGRALRVPDRVVAHLLGDDTTDRALSDLLTDASTVPWGDPDPLAGALRSGVRLAYLREPPTGSGVALAAQALRAIGRGAVVLDLQRLTEQADADTLARLAAREARLVGAGLVAAPARAIAERPRVVAALAADRLPLLLVGPDPWDPDWSREPPLVVDVPQSTTGERAALWQAALDERAITVDVAAATAPFRLRPDQVERAARAAGTQSVLAADGRITVAHVRYGARAENGTALDRLARRVEPEVGWDDLVLPPPVLVNLREVALRARYRERVLGDWQMRPGGGRGHGVAALFAGDSGTGKTMSAEVVAGELGLDLYVVDLATVVDKYVGETEKNLERIFTAAAGVNGVLLFDEADAVFGKRSEVRDAHDRYANVESAYLLQRMESFDGLVILATNLRANIDDAFTRRLDVVVDFPLPDADHRRALWNTCLGSAMRRATDIDLDYCASAFELAGGAIRSAAVTAAYLAADDGGDLTMRHLVTAVHREYRKIGRLTLQSEFGPYWALLG